MRRPVIRRRAVLIFANVATVLLVIAGQRLLAPPTSEAHFPQEVSFQIQGAAAPHAVTLPHDWRSEPATGKSSKGRYRLVFSLPENPQSLWAIYLPQHRFVARLAVNGEPIGATGRTEPPISRRHFSPDIVPVPPSLLGRGDNAVTIDLISDPPGLGHLAVPQLGPHMNLAPVRDRAYWISITLTQFAAAIVFALGAILLILWRARIWGRAYGYFAAICFIWPLHMSNRFWTDPPVPAFIWERVIFLAAFWMAVLGLMFALRLTRFKTPRSEQLVGAAGGAVTVLFAALPFPIFMTWAQLILTPASVTLALATLSLLILHAWRRRDRYAMLFSVAATAMATSAVLDALKLLRPSEGMIVFSLQYTAVFVVGGVGAMLIHDFIVSTRAVRTLNRTLEERLALRERQLAEAFEERREAERNSAALSERARMMGELHDGLGARLVALLHLAKHHARDSRVVGGVEGALRELRFLSGPLRWNGADLASLLGNFREQRLQPLERSGLDVAWRVDKTPRQIVLSPPEAAHFLRLLDEATANVLKHASRKELVVTLRENEVRVELTLTNPCAPTAADGNAGAGLASMARRAELMGAGFAAGRNAGDFRIMLSWG